MSAAAAVIVGLGATGAVAANLITSADIRDGAVHGVDIARGAVGSTRLKSGSVGHNQIRDNAITGDDLSGGVLHKLNSVGSLVGPSWGIVDRVVSGSGVAYLRTGPTSNTLGQGLVDPPLGSGSLGLLTGSGTDKAAFGNQVSFNGDLVSSLTTLGFSVYTTRANNDRGRHNMPSIVIEIDPQVAAAPNDGVASMVYTPPNGRDNAWTSFDATDNTQGAVWSLTGASGAAINCGPGVQCTWDQIQNRLEDGDGHPARIFTVQVTKERGFAFSGAVDALRVRERVYNFEALGVVGS